jgi:branched-subunit amino acid aminotransferase/4-amino-4-deoxychorismate lyase
MLKNNRYTLKTGQYTVDDIMNADFAFTTNSISEIRSVESIDDTIFSGKHNEIETICSLFEVEKNRMLKK